ncbi:hypothetical protein TRFO_28200 [Tritrichomonas foetus]|uniref:non-specific serine/threonine protein kinase n=1 Tax=Tritrichomonas foetus TaxID=1144522 RepID=A0A1J4K047_9EUKA|nr:hypothetical protein TRFO_28200 [Tritrichomonas foetus]|eukprot:OHT04314.1 hypothetical protein TRFO_28200 [Tritrichomonas foetus]
MEIILGDRFAMKQRIGSGCFGELFEGVDVSTKRKVALKLEKVAPKSIQLLREEAEIYKKLQDSVGIPEFFWYGTQLPYNILSIELLDNCLENLMKKCGGRFSLKTVLMLADQMISTIERFHRNYYLHRDLKPENFMIGCSQKSNIIHIIDYGLSKMYMNPSNNVHIPLTEKNDLTGTARYASIHALSGLEQGRRDDMESLGYLFIYFLKGSLPWQGLPGKTREEKYRNIREAKISTPVEELCSNIPRQFADYINFTRQLRFTEEPDYSMYRKIFRDLFIESNFVYDYNFDWSTPKEQPTVTSQLSQRSLPAQIRENSNQLNQNLKPVSRLPSVNFSSNRTTERSKPVSKYGSRPQMVVQSTQRIRQPLSSKKIVAYSPQKGSPTRYKPPGSTYIHRSSAGYRWSNAQKKY